MIKKYFGTDGIRGKVNGSKIKCLTSLLNKYLARYLFIESIEIDIL